MNHSPLPPFTIILSPPLHSFPFRYPILKFVAEPVVNVGPGGGMNEPLLGVLETMAFVSGRRYYEMVSRNAPSPLASKTSPRAGPPSNGAAPLSVHRTREQRTVFSPPAPAGPISPCRESLPA